MEESSGEKGTQQHTFTRRGFIEGSIGALALAGLYRGREQFEEPQSPPKFPEPPQKAPEDAIAKESLVLSPIGYGFNTHMHVSNEKGENHTLEAFKRGVDQLAGNNQKWIRFNFMDWEVLEKGDDGALQWNGNVSLYDEALQYAKNAGLKVFFVTSVPKFASEYPLEEYKKTTESFYTDIAQRFKVKVDLWQIFNEPDIHNFRNYGVHLGQLLDSSYTNELAETIDTAANAIKKVDPDAKTTANVSHWIGHGIDLEEKGAYFFDHVGKSLDTITLDLYPDDNLAEIQRLPSYIEYFQQRYNKPVIIGEMGLPTFGRFTDSDQAKYVGLMLDSLNGGRVKPEGVLLYELLDETTAGGVENHFGFEKADRTEKEAFPQVVVKMQVEEQNDPQATSDKNREP